MLIFCKFCQIVFSAAAKLHRQYEKAFATALAYYHIGNIYLYFLLLVFLDGQFEKKKKIVGKIFVSGSGESCRSWVSHCGTGKTWIIILMGE